MVADLTSDKRIDWLISQLEILGGAEKLVLTCVPRLRAAGWDIKVVTLTSGGESIGELREMGVPVTALNLGSLSKSMNISRLVRMWAKDPPNLVHTHLYHAGIIGRIACKFTGISPVLVHQHGPERNRTRIRSFLDRSTSNWVTRYIASCQAVSQTMQEREGIPASKIEVIYNGVESAQQYETIRPMGWPGRVELPTLVYAGRLSPEKGLLTLIQALGIVDKSPVKFQCLILGEGSTSEAITREIEHTGLKEKIFLLGKKSDIGAWLQHCEIFVLPSIWEGASIALLEAMAAGLPVVATATGGTPELVEDGISGILVPPADPTALAGALIQLLGSVELRDKMGKAGYKLVHENFRIEITVDRISALYSGLLG